MWNGRGVNHRPKDGKRAVPWMHWRIVIVVVAIPHLSGAARGNCLG